MYVYSPHTLHLRSPPLAAGVADDDVAAAVQSPGGVVGTLVRVALS